MMRAKMMRGEAGVRATADKVSHDLISTKLVFETVIVFAILALTISYVYFRVDSSWKWLALAPLIVAQGLWLDRLYTVAHEAIHKKLFPAKIRLNDTVGAALLLPIIAPFTVYRKIHYFHHGRNRHDPETAALDYFAARAPESRASQIYYRVVWTFYVFFGGFFFHSLVTILIFLFVPTSRAKKISVVFGNWRTKMRARAWAEFLAGITFHSVIYFAFGFEAWLVALGLPLVVFAWVWSLLLYIYHYDTTTGPDVRHNVRSLPRHPFFSWLLLNFNEHTTHHYDPTLPWYKLPRHRHVLPAPFAANENVRSIWQAIWQQRRGPRLRARN